MEENWFDDKQRINMYHMATLAHLPKVCYKHNISTSDSEQNVPKGDFACRIITLGKALNSFSKAIVFDT